MSDSTVSQAVSGVVLRRTAVPGFGQERGLPILVIIFFFSLMLPILLPVGPFLLMPHRLFLLIAFFPLVFMLFTGKAGQILLIDKLMMAGTAWACLALLVNHGASGIEPLGMHTLEFFGAYLVGRVCIRSAQDFLAFVRFFFVIVLVLAVFAAAEAITHRPILLDLIPRSIAPAETGMRWGMRRAQTVFVHPILFGAFVSTGFGLFWYVLRVKGGFGTSFFGSFMSGIATVFSLSTGALISIVMQCIFIGWDLVSRGIRKRWTIFGGLCAAAYITVDLISNRTPFHVLVTYASFNTASAYNRINIWIYGTNNVERNPIFGIGMGDWARPTWMSASVDNFWLLLTMQFGLPMIICFIPAVLLIVRQVALRDFKTPLERACQAGFLTSLGGAALAGGTVHYWHTIMAFMLFFFASGIWMITAREDDEGDGDAVPDDPEPSTRYTRTTHRTPPRKMAQQAGHRRQRRRPVP